MCHILFQSKSKVGKTFRATQLITKRSDNNHNTENPVNEQMFITNSAFGFLKKLSTYKMAKIQFLNELCNVPYYCITQTPVINKSLL